MEKSPKQSTLSTRVSYELALLIAKKGSAHTVGEELIIPAAKIISNALFDEKCTKQINEIPLSNTTVKRRIDEMSENVKEVLVTFLRKSEYFSLQFDESTDVAGKANLLAFCRFEWNGNIQEEMLFCQSLPTRKIGEVIFKAADNFMKENEIDWTHCSIHREALAGKDCHKIFVQDKIEAMIIKLQRWARKVDQDSFDAFPTLHDFIETNEIKVDRKTAATIKDHLNAMASRFRHFFPKIEDEIQWIRNPFEENYLSKLKLSSSEEDSLIELSCHQSLKSLFKTTPLVPFWINARQEYPVIAKIALSHLMGFSTTYLCKRAFSTLVFLKNKYRNKLNVESDLRLKLSRFNPDIESLVEDKQCQKSH
ncbi:zinc finger BED domain-containing protein 5-like [Uloborus diversus]|uniref:zinc finger BED domain-containing protein 5-like n=1 Tax=Uloborus diversus TaxID=327109 RepID=UPI00240A93D0|nr:zinc finger BED domain-containing protein 5-like [Uloborus diversus]